MGWAVLGAGNIPAWLYLSLTIARVQIRAPSQVGHIPASHECYIRPPSCFLYCRQHLVSVKQTYQYPDTQPGDEDVFSREPFVVWFHSPKTGETFQKQIVPPRASLREQDRAGWIRAHGGGRQRGHILPPCCVS